MEQIFHKFKTLNMEIEFNSQHPIDTLLPELWVYILSFLTVDERCKMLMVDKKFYQLVMNRCLYYPLQFKPMSSLGAHLDAVILQDIESVSILRQYPTIYQEIFTQDRRHLPTITNSFSQVTHLCLSGGFFSTHTSSLRRYVRDRSRSIQPPQTAKSIDYMWYVLSQAMPNVKYLAFTPENHQTTPSFDPIFYFPKLQFLHMNLFMNPETSLIYNFAIRYPHLKWIIHDVGKEPLDPLVGYFCYFVHYLDMKHWDDVWFQQLPPYSQLSKRVRRYLLIGLYENLNGSHFDKVLALMTFYPDLAFENINIIRPESIKHLMPKGFSQPAEMWQEFTFENNTEYYFDGNEDQYFCSLLVYVWAGILRNTEQVEPPQNVLKILDMLIHPAHVNIPAISYQDKTKIYPIQLAMFHPNETLRLKFWHALIQAGANIHTPDSPFKPPFIYAVEMAIMKQETTFLRWFLDALLKDRFCSTFYKTIYHFSTEQVQVQTTLFLSLLNYTNVLPGCSQILTQIMPPPTDQIPKLPLHYYRLHNTHHVFSPFRLINQEKVDYQLAQTLLDMGFSIDTLCFEYSETSQNVTNAFSNVMEREHAEYAIFLIERGANTKFLEKRVTLSPYYSYSVSMWELYQQFQKKNKKLEALLCA